MLAGFGFAWVCGFLFANVGGVVVWFGAFEAFWDVVFWFDLSIWAVADCYCVWDFDVVGLFCWFCVGWCNMRFWFELVSVWFCVQVAGGLRLAGFGGLRVLWVSWPVAICVVV